MLLFTFLALIVIVLQNSVVLGGNILALYTLDIKSHYILVQPLLTELALDGHNVTVITSFKISNPPSNYREIIIPFTALNDFKEAMSKGSSSFGIFSVLHNFHEYGINTTKTMFQDDRVTELFKQTNHFDLIITSFAESGVLRGLAYKYDCPVIVVSTMKINPIMEVYTGSFAYDSFVSNIFLPYSDDMTFGQRVLNTIANNFLRIIMHLGTSRLTETYNELFSDPKPSYMEMYKNTVALTLINSHLSINKPTPLMTNMIEVAGMQIPDKQNALPKDLADFIDNAPDGVIYFCMGSTLKTQDFDVKKQTAIIETLKTYPLKIIWKWDDPIDLSPEQTANIYISKWLPQNDILAHPNIKAYITHGGLLSTTEAIYHGVPFVGIPVFGDQRMNLQKFRHYGIAVELDFDNLSVDTLTQAINEVVQNVSYRLNAKLLSTRFRDRPITALQNAKFWVQYVMRHGNAEFFHSAAKNLNGFQYFNLDVYAFIVGIFIFVIYVLTKLLICLCQIGLKKFGHKKKQKQT